MPLLLKEPVVYPEGLLTQPHAPAEPEARWWVLHTRPRAEKCVARAAHREGIAFFLPVYHRRWENRRRRFSAYLPLFPGYVFIRGDDVACAKLRETHSVANALPVTDQARLQGDLARVYRLMDAGLPLTPEERLQPGARVLITDGPLRGFEGRVTRCGARLKLHVEVEFIRRGVSVEVDQRSVQALEPTEAGAR